jgi:iron complex outermembrane receptor protein
MQVQFAATVVLSSLGLLALSAVSVSASMAAEPVDVVQPTDPVEPETIIVIGSGQSSAYDVAQPKVVLDKSAIDRNPGNTLGTLLDDLPGVANASFGPGVGRPVIRGIGGSRVKILVNGSDSADVSAMSSDHSAMAEPVSAEKVEVIYGPAALLYGGGAVGGVMNVVDERIREQPGEGLTGSTAVRGSTNDDGFGVDAQLGMRRANWSLHLNGFERDAGDYRSGKRGDAHSGSNAGRIANSDSESRGGAVALSWADGRNGFIGGSISALQNDYGVPNLDGARLRVTPDQIRYDMKGAWWPDPQGRARWLEEWRTEVSFNDYEHAESGEEFDVPGAAIVDVGLFEQQTWEIRSRLRHAPIGPWQGTFGVQVTYQDLALCHDHGGCPGIPSYSAPWNGEIGFNLANRETGGFLLSHDTPMPLTRKIETGLFIVEQRDWSRGTIEVGARIDSISLRANPDPIDPNWRQQRSYYADNSYPPLSLSAAGTWVLSDRQRLGLTLSRVQRAPEAPEIFWNGDHHATFSFQLDNPDLDLETAWAVDLNWLRGTERNSYKVAVFHYRFDDYIYNDLKDFVDPFHGNDVYRHEQADARFFGAELSWHHRLAEHWAINLNGDLVRAERTDGEPLPRIPPASLLLGVNYTLNRLDARLATQWVRSQNEVAGNELASDGHVLIDAGIGYRLALRASQLRLAMAAQNLTDEYAVNHVSFLKQAAPLPGRNVQISVRWMF